MRDDLRKQDVPIDAESVGVVERDELGLELGGVGVSVWERPRRRREKR